MSAGRPRTARQRRPQAARRRSRRLDLLEHNAANIESRTHGSRMPDACVRLRCSARGSLVPLRDSLLNAQRS
jgi:hypothetical protein